MSCYDWFFKTGCKGTAFLSFDKAKTLKCARFNLKCAHFYLFVQ
jgi:hypothetical protein